MSTPITCPKCDHQFSVEEAIAEKVEQGYADELKQKEQELKEAYKLQLDQLSKREQKLAKSEAEEEQRLNHLLQQKEKEVQKRLRKDFANQFEAQIKALEAENQEKSKRLKSLQKQELDLQQREQALIEASQDQEMTVQKLLLAERKKLQEQMDDRLNERVNLELHEKELLINQLRENIEDMKRKSEQGSMQVQGEAQELALEEMLQSRFPFDRINEVGKGQRGADCIQVVRNPQGEDCGTIIYESKRTKSFSKTWLNKLKLDALNASANIPVLVTEAMPDGQKGIIQMDHVWVCDFHSAHTLAMILRFALIKEHQAIGSQENKGEKMQMLYDYLTGNEFAMQIRTIVEGFEDMQLHIQKQRRSMEASWKKQEKALELVIQSTIGLHSSVKGIAGKAVASIPQLELGED